MPEPFYALVDYDNQRPPRFGHWASEGRRPNLRDHEEYVDTLLKALVAVREQIDPGFAELRIRLYGGWNTVVHGERTEAADMVAQAIARLGRSTRIRNTRVFLELAETLLVAPGELLAGTLRSTRWRGEVMRFQPQPPNCHESPATCPFLTSFHQWSKGRCPKGPECPVETSHVVAFQGQKLVDAMLVADIISGSAYLKAHVLTVSMDDDMIPGLLTARLLGGTVTVVRFGRHDRSAYDPLLMRYGISIIDLPAFGG